MMKVVASLTEKKKPTATSNLLRCSSLCPPLILSTSKLNTECCWWNHEASANAAAWAELQLRKTYRNSGVLAHKYRCGWESNSHAFETRSMSSGHFKIWRSTANVQTSRAETRMIPMIPPVWREHQILSLLVTWASEAANVFQDVDVLLACFSGSRSADEARFPQQQRND